MRRPEHLAVAANRTLAWLEHMLDTGGMNAPYAKQMQELAADLRYGLGTGEKPSNGDTDEKR